VSLIRALACCVVIGTASPEAHHSFAAQYDSDKPITLSGTIVRVDWTNPHMHFSLEVKDGKGAVVQWTFECYPPNMLVRQGWQRGVTLKPGTHVTVAGWRARIEPNLAAAREVTFPDGRKLMAGPPAGTGGQ
jgi:hypothetical protein